MFLYMVTIVNNVIFFIQLYFPFMIAGKTHDQTNSRPNTLMDDADDIQRQLENEMRDKIRNGLPKTVWVFHLTSPLPMHKLLGPWHPRHLTPTKEATKRSSWEKLPTCGSLWQWDYKEQKEWPSVYPECGGRSQSPVDLPLNGLVKTKGARKIKFQNYDLLPQKLSLHYEGRRVILYGEWEKHKRPLVSGGAAHSRRYYFHSLIFHWPSEHTVGGFQYPVECQALHVAAEYKNMKEAMASLKKDPQAFLAIAHLFKYSNYTQEGLKDVFDKAVNMGFGVVSLGTLKPLSHFSPQLREYAFYYGSLTAPPCSEAVLWMISARVLPIERELANTLFPDGTPQSSMLLSRNTQAMNDRKFYYFS